MAKLPSVLYCFFLRQKHSDFIPTDYELVHRKSVQNPDCNTQFRIIARKTIFQESIVFCPWSRLRREAINIKYQWTMITAIGGKMVVHSCHLTLQLLPFWSVFLKADQMPLPTHQDTAMPTWCSKQSLPSSAVKLLSNRIFVHQTTVSPSS